MENEELAGKAKEIRARIDAIQDDLDYVRHIIISDGLDNPTKSTNDNDTYQAAMARYGAHCARVDLMFVWRFLGIFIFDEEHAKKNNI